MPTTKHQRTERSKILFLFVVVVVVAFLLGLSNLRGLSMISRRNNRQLLVHSSPVAVSSSSSSSSSSTTPRLSWSKITVNEQIDAVRKKMMMMAVNQNSSRRGSASSSYLRKILTPYVRYMSERMIRPLSFWGEQHYALSETVFPLSGDWWYWTDDNAKTLEMFTLPGLYETFQESADHLIRFVMALMRSEFVFRRVAGIPADQNANGIVIESNQWLDWRLHNGLMHYRTSNGGNILHQAFRFHDGRSVSYTSAHRPLILIKFRPNSTLLCPTVQYKVQKYERFLRMDGWGIFTSEDKDNVCLLILEPLKTMIRAHSEGPLRKVGNSSVVSSFKTDYYSSSVDRGGNAQVLSDQQKRRLILSAEFSFEVSAQSTRAITSVNFTNISPEVDEVQLGFITDFSGAWSFFCGSYQGQLDCVSPPHHQNNHPKKRRRFLSKHSATGKGPQWYSVLQSSAQGFSYGLHKFVTDPDQFFQMGALEESADSPQIALTMVLYRCKNVNSGSCYVQEDQILTGGGFYSSMDLYQGLFTSGAATQDGLGLIDFSISYDIGAELNGLATHYAFAAKRQYSKQASVSVTELKGLIDRHTKRYWTSFGMKRIENYLGDPAYPNYPNLFSRGVGFMLLASTTMYAVTKEPLYLDSIRRALEAMHAFQNLNAKINTIQFRCFGGQPFVFHDCQAAVLLGIARVLSVFDPEFHSIGIDEEMLLGVLNGGWQAFIVVQKRLPCCPKFETLDVIQLQPPSIGEDTVDWNFKSGILLRAVHATLQLPSRYFEQLAPETLNKMAMIKRCAETFLWNATQVHHRTPATSGSNNTKKTNEKSKQKKNMILGSTEGTDDDEDETLMLEIKTSMESGETNTETQPWAVLGLYGSAVEGLYMAKSREWLGENKRWLFESLWKRVTKLFLWSS